MHTIDLIPGGSSIPVTKDTRQKYVDAYVNYVMTEAVKDPFEAFAKGFLRVCHGNVLVCFVTLMKYVPYIDWEIFACKILTYVKFSR